VNEPGEISVRVFVSSVDFFEQTLHEVREYELVVGGETVRRERHELDLRMYAQHELGQMLTTAGFEDVTWYGDWRGPVSAGSNNFVCGARRP
jgi:hypothetical protein